MGYHMTSENIATVTVFITLSKEDGEAELQDEMEADNGKENDDDDDSKNDIYSKKKRTRRK